MSQTASSSATPPRSVSVSRAINAPAERVWSLISDVTRMGEWSPETTSCAWLKGATTAAVGARFKGINQNGKKKWSTTCKVSQCEPGKSFAFLVDVGAIKVAGWAYTIVADGSSGDSCNVTETWTDRRSWLTGKLGKPLSGVADRSEHNRAGMATTLDNLAAAAEQL